MKGRVFITSSGYDPELGKLVKDPYLGDGPTLGACRPDIRRQLHEGDHLFVISGKIPEIDQFVMGGFEIESKISALEAYERFPHLRLSKLDDGQINGNIIVDASGKQHELDHHDVFEKRILNYVVGTNLLTLTSEHEIALGRSQTLDALCEIFKKKGKRPIDVVGRHGRGMTEEQIYQLREWLQKVKASAN